MTKPSKVKLIKDRHSKGVQRKQHWMTMYQLVGEYVMTRKQNFLTTNLPGEFLTEQLFSSVAPEANRTMASALLGNLWPSGGRSFRIERPRNIADSKEVKDYYNEITEVLAENMDLPEAGLATALDEYMLDQGGFGISGIHSEATGDFFIPIRYHAINVKNMVIEENKDGMVDAIFIDREINVDQAVSTYGLNAVSKKTRDKFNEGNFLDPVRVLQLVEPRREGVFGFGNKNFPISSIHLEYDTDVILKESGFKQHPIAVGRFTKALGEVYGRSPAMFAMTAIIRLNVAWEILMRASEKNVNPPLYLLDNGALGAGVVDTSPGALNVFNTTSMNERSPIGALFDVGDIQPLQLLIEQLTNEVGKGFFIDRLMDLNNQTRMTLGEVQVRDRIRGEGLTSVFKRQETELFSPLINSSFNILFEQGLLGVERGSTKEAEMLAQGLAPIYIPEPVINALKRGQKVYKIKYISPANRIMRIEELQGITQNLDIALGMAQGGLGEVLDNYNVDEIARDVNELTNATNKMINDTKTIQQIRALRAKQQEAQQQMTMAQVGADVAMKGAQAQSMTQGAISGRPRG